MTEILSFSATVLAKALLNKVDDLQAENERLKEELKTIKRVVDDTGLINTWPSYEGSILAGRVKQIAEELVELCAAAEYYFGFDKAPDLIDDYQAYKKRSEDNE